LKGLSDTNMDINAEIAARTEQIETIITRYLPKEEGNQKTVITAMNYSIQAGGKRLRPMLMLETYRMFGGRSKVIEPFMVAIEMIHTYSLVHDDLPAIDNDEFRRGKKTTHAQFGEAMGILAGDGLLNEAVNVILKACYSNDLKIYEKSKDYQKGKVNPFADTLTNTINGNNVSNGTSTSTGSNTSSEGGYLPNTGTK